MTQQRDRAVTVLVARRVAAGHEPEFHQWAQGILAAAATFPGHLGSGLLRPGHPGQPWHLVHRFQDAPAYRAWLDSPERAQWFDQASEHHEEMARRELHGVEGWFAAGAPPRWKMVIGSWIGVFPISLLANVALAPVLTALPLLARTALFAALFSTAMTYLAMPTVTRLLSRWLYPSQARRRKPD